MSLTEADVAWCYREFLNRPPESEEIVEQFVASCENWRMLVRNFLFSQEFLERMANVSLTSNPAALSNVNYLSEQVISYAQNGEDVLLNRAFQGKSNGSFIDVGAGHPLYDNVTFWQRRKGWRGVNIEPNPFFYMELQKLRPDDVNLNVGLADRDAVLTFYQVEQNEHGHGWGLSSFDPRAEQTASQLGFKVNQMPARVTTLDQIVEERFPKGVDLIKISAEGYEQAIVLFTDWRRTKAQVICIRALEPNSAVPAWPKWEVALMKAGYRCAAFDGINRYYCRAEDAATLTQLSAPVCCNDRYRRATGKDYEVS